MDFSIYSANKKMCFEAQTPQANGSTHIRRAVVQPSGLLWMYSFYKGSSVGVPVRSQAYQERFQRFIETVKEGVK